MACWGMGAPGGRGSELQLGTKDDDGVSRDADTDRCSLLDGHFDIHEARAAGSVALGKLFKGKFMDLLRQAQAKGELGLTDVAFNVLMARLAKQDWNIYVKRPYREAWHALAYLGRYVHRVGIANSRILDDTGDLVTFRTKGKAKATLPGRTFVRRFLLHVLPTQFTKVRHFGLYAFPRPGGLLEQARACLGNKEIPELWRRPLPDEQELDAAQRDWNLPEARVCPDCKVPMARTLLPRPRAPPAAGAA